MSTRFFAAALFVLLQAESLHAQLTVPNAGFEQADAAARSKTAHWKAESEDFVCIADKESPYKGNRSLRVESRTDGNHFFNTELPFSTEGLKKYRVSCAFRTKGLKGSLQLGARVFDAEGGTISKTVFTLTEDPNSGWTRGEGVFVSDLSAAKLRVFGNLRGTGEGWFDEMQLTELDEPRSGATDEVRLYVHEFFDYIYESSIVTDRAYLANLKARTMYLCGDSTSLEDCRRILQSYTTPMLNDGHSFFTTAAEWKAMMGGGKHPATGTVHHNMPTGATLKGPIALIRLPTFVSSEEALLQQYADSLQRMIARADRPELKGYIIDLSENGGGNCMPMIGGIGPLIGDGICEYSFSGDGSVRALFYDHGRVGWDSSVQFAKPDPYTLKHQGKPIAVIYSGQTGSSGEVTAIAFIGLPGAKSFGQPTAGASTRVDNFELSDGAYLNLAAGVDADRNRNKFGGKIKPDVETANHEQAIAAAVKWIEETSR